MQHKSLSHREYLSIAFPFIVSTVTQPLLGAVDTAVVGHLDSPVYIGGVAIGTVILNTIYWLFGFFRVSTTSQSAIALGSGKKNQVAASLMRPFMLAAGVGLLLIFLQAPIWLAAQGIISPEPAVAEQAHTYFSILIWGAPLVLINYSVIGWLMGQARTKATLFTQVTGNVLNIILDIAFVTYWGFGVAGVAVASLLAQATTLVLGLYFVAKTANLSLSDYLATARISKTDLQTIASSNSDLMLRTVCLLAMFNIMAKVGASLGATVLASNAVLMQVTFIASYIFDGIANASSVFAGKSLGQQNPNLLALTFRRTNQWTFSVMAMLTFVTWGLGSSFGGIFTDIPEVLQGYNSIRHWAVAFPLAAGFGLTYYGIFTGSGTTRPVRNSTIFSLATFVLCLFIFVNMWGNDGLWLSFIIFYIGRAAYLLPYQDQVRSKVYTPAE